VFDTPLTPQVERLRGAVSKWLRTNIGGQGVEGSSARVGRAAQIRTQLARHDRAGRHAIGIKPLTIGVITYILISSIVRF
jgi:hypothetical protein